MHEASGVWQLELLWQAWSPLDFAVRAQEVKEAGKDGAEEDGAGEEGGTAPRASPHVVVIGATNRPDSLDTALRCGRAHAAVTRAISRMSGRRRTAICPCRLCWT